MSASRLARATAVLALAMSACDAGAVGLEAGGYLRAMPLLWRPPAATAGPTEDTRRRWSQVVDARENLKVFPASHATFGLELKQRLIDSEGAEAVAAALDRTGTQQTWFDWRHSWSAGSRDVSSTAIDRAWLDVQAGRGQVTIGRQRIAWGTGLVWNPIDIFNPSSPLDFENVEKPGTDAARVQVYLGPNSKLDLAAVPAHDADAASGAGELVVNRAGFDWVVLAGRRGAWALLGGAWAGSVHGAGFRGEFLLSRPRAGERLVDGSSEPRTNEVASIDGDYTFASSLYLHAAILYNALGATGASGGTRLLAAEARDWLSPARGSLFGELARNLGPLVRADLSGILDPGDRSWYLGPTLTISAVTNLDVTLGGLAFGGRRGTEFGENGDILLARVQCSY